MECHVCMHVIECHVFMYGMSQGLRRPDRVSVNLAVASRASARARARSQARATQRQVADAWTTFGSGAL